MIEEQLDLGFAPPAEPVAALSRAEWYRQCDAALLRLERAGVHELDTTHIRRMVPPAPTPNCWGVWAQKAFRKYGWYEAGHRRSGHSLARGRVVAIWRKR